MCEDSQGPVAPPPRSEEPGGPLEPAEPQELTWCDAGGCTDPSGEVLAAPAEIGSHRSHLSTCDERTGAGVDPRVVRAVVNVLHPAERWKGGSVPTAPD